MLILGGVGYGAGTNPLAGLAGRDHRQSHGLGPVASSLRHGSGPARRRVRRGVQGGAHQARAGMYACLAAGGN